MFYIGRVINLIEGFIIEVNENIFRNEGEYATQATYRLCDLYRLM